MDNEFVWIGLQKPTREDLLMLQGRFDLQELSIADALSPLQMPKLSVYDDRLFVIAKTAQLEADHITYGETAIIAGKRNIITVRNGSERGHQELPGRLEHRRTRCAMVLTTSCTPSSISVSTVIFPLCARSRIPYGYFVVLAVIAVMCIALFVRFKGARWI